MESACFASFPVGLARQSLLLVCGLGMIGGWRSLGVVISCYCCIMFLGLRFLLLAEAGGQLP